MIYNNSAGGMVLSLYLDDPEAKFHIREIGRRTGLHPNTVSQEVKRLVKEGLLTKRKTRLVVEVGANRDNERFFVYKRFSNVIRLYESGLVNYLYEIYNSPEAIILFGSYSKGEDVKRSDIDLAIITKRKLNASMNHYQDKLGRTIQVFELELDKVHKNLLTSLANGITLKGYLELP